MIVVPQTSSIVSQSYLACAESSMLVDHAKSLIFAATGDHMPSVKKRAKTVKYSKYAEYAALCNNEEWKKYMMSLANGEVKKSRYLTYDNESFKCDRKVQNSIKEPLFTHAVTPTLIDLMKFQEYLRDKALFCSNEDKIRITSGAATKTKNTRDTSKKDRTQSYINYIKSERFMTACKQLGVVHMNIVLDAMINLVYMKRFDNYITMVGDNYIMPDLAHVLRQECLHAFIS